MSLTWPEIRENAVRFAHAWSDESSEHAEAKTFWNEFFGVFGLRRRRYAVFEHPVKRRDGSTAYIDVFWKGMLLIEHKSRGKNLDRAFAQARDYFTDIKDRDLPRYVLVSDFARFRLYDLEEGSTHEFPLKELQKNVKLFGFMVGYESRSFAAEDPVNSRAATQLGDLHRLLAASGYEGHPLEVYLVRLLFCMFADDTGIFEKDSFREYVELGTEESGLDVGQKLEHLFQVLNTPPRKRQKFLDEQLSCLPFVNGRLFSEALPIAAFSREMRETLLDCLALDWSRISPAVFGSLFQSIMGRPERRKFGAHYTTESNILKVLTPLFLDSLRSELENCASDQKKLRTFHERLSNIRILDPACGCGNFLVVAYRELRLLEIEILRRTLKTRRGDVIDISLFLRVNVDQFFGIEIDEWPAQIATVAMWLTDHQMNMKCSEEFGQYFVRLPLVTAPNIACRDALQISWSDVVDARKLNFIVGNPPFVGKKEQSPTQKAQVASVFAGIGRARVLDYVSCWYLGALSMMEANPSIRAAFVSTNSITQGEQVGVLWPVLLRRGVRINFAHRTFQWTTEAKGRAAVHCVVIGFALEDAKQKLICDYETPAAQPDCRFVAHINPYLVPAPDVILQSRAKPLAKAAPILSYGSQPIDDGWLLLTEQERDDLIREDPRIAEWIRPAMGADEFLNSLRRYCLWLVDIKPQQLRELSVIRGRIEACREFRLGSERAGTKKLADTPYLFGEIRQPKSPFLVIPKVSSENRQYLPIGYCTPETVVTGTVLTAPGAELVHFGVLSSSMHNAWMRSVGGRLESRYQYSSSIVYNNFPWPELAGAREVGRIEEAARRVMEVRERHRGATLADLYDSSTMPRDLLLAHRDVDVAVDKAYRAPKFASEADRVAFLFELYERIDNSLGLPRTIGRVPGKKRRVRQA